MSQITSEFVVARRQPILEGWRGAVMESTVGAEYVTWACDHDHPTPEGAHTCAGKELDRRYERRHANAARFAI